ncbi:hypothetical protein B0O99DRAFT_139046 [Bisporella sp. PMI_857]|nr:hypothetical protein B0O99DRAFT_139046 [Bisporella sp. PMI_857]
MYVHARPRVVATLLHCWIRPGHRNFPPFYTAFLFFVCVCVCVCARARRKKNPFPLRYDSMPKERKRKRPGAGGRRNGRNKRSPIPYLQTGEPGRSKGKGASPCQNADSPVVATQIGSADGNLHRLLYAAKIKAYEGTTYRTAPHRTAPYRYASLIRPPLRRCMSLGVGYVWGRVPRFAGGLLGARCCR